jgi:thymidylate kinase
VIVALEGIDGAGKTVVGELLMRRLVAKGVRTEHFDKHRFEFGAGWVNDRMRQLRAIIWPAEREPDQDRLGTHFYLFLLAAWFCGLRQVITPDRSKTYDVVIMDGSYYRVIAKAHRRYDLPIPWLLSLFSNALEPDCIVLLDLDPTLAWTRRAAFKATELGRWDGVLANDPRQAFCQYQSDIRQTLRQLAHDRGWLVVDQSTTTAPADVASIIEQAIVGRMPR